MSKPKILEQIENAGGVFIVTKGATSYAKIKEAYDSGKDIICPYNNNIYELITIPTGSNDLIFRKRDFTNNGNATTSGIQFTLRASGSWDEYLQAFVPNRAAASIYRDTDTEISSSTGYYRPIRISTSEPTASDGNIGDIWIQYDAD